MTVFHLSHTFSLPSTVQKSWNQVGRSYRQRSGKPWCVLLGTGSKVTPIHNMPLHTCKHLVCDMVYSLKHSVVFRTRRYNISDLVRMELDDKHIFKGLMLSLQCDTVCTCAITAELVFALNYPGVACNMSYDVMAYFSLEKKSGEWLFELLFDKCNANQGVPGKPA